MKVGTDGVLLGAWCRVDPLHDKAILDIGTGTGVIALQLAQRTEVGFCRTAIDAVEIDEQSCRRAEDNFRHSDWCDRLRVYHSAIQCFAEQRQKEREQSWEYGEKQHEGVARYDHIVSNPPYFIDSLSSPDPSRAVARHSGSLGYDDLMKCCVKLLAPGGSISLILPTGAETEKMIATANQHGFVVSRRTEVHSTPESGPKRTLLEFSRRNFVPESTSLVIQDAGPGTFSAEYRDLTRDFYLYF